MHTSYPCKQEVPEEDYMNRNYLINGRSSDVRTISVANYGYLRKPSKKEIRDKIVDFFSGGFNATNIEVIASETVE